MSLSSLFVQREVATMRQVEEALARQVIYGGDLVTNLLEVARVDEEIVTRLLAEMHRLPAAPPGELPSPSDSARKLVPSQMAAERAMVPLAVEQGKLVVAVAEPLPPSVEEELAFALGMPVEQKVAPMVRVRQALAAAYALPLERRMERLLARLSGAAPASGGSIPPILAQAPQVAEPPRPPSQPPFRRSPASGTPAAPPFKHRVTSQGFPAPLPPPEPPPAPALEPAPAPAPEPAPEPAPAPAPDPAPARASSRPPAPPSVRPMLLQRDATANVRPLRRRRGPLLIDDAKKEADDATDRDALLDLFFDFARQYFDFSALFIVHGDIAEGRDAWGAGASRERVVGIGVPLDMPSLLSTARDKRAPLTAAAAADGLDAVLLADLQRTTRAPVLVVPIVVRTRAVALLLGDCGDAGVDLAALKDVIAFASTIGHGFERLIVKRKLSGFVGGVPASDVGRVSASPSLAQLAAKRRTVPPAPPLTGVVATPIGAIIPTTMASASSAPRVPAVIPSRASSSAALQAQRASSPPPAPAPPRTPSSQNLEALDEPLLSAVVSEAGGSRPEMSSTLPPPPANVLSVRRPTGPPIPREEPLSDRAPAPPVESAPIEPTPTEPQAPVAPIDTEPPPPSSGPAIDSAALDDANAQALLDDEGTQALLDALATEEPPKEPPTSESMAIAIPPHRPPSSRVGPVAALPSVIVDLDSEIAVLVDRFIQTGEDAAEAELLRQGQTAMRAIMARFPGPIVESRGRLSEGPLRVVDCGPLLRLIAGQRKVALPFVLEALDELDAEKRYWATFLLTELPYPEAAPPLVARLFDEEARTRKAARMAMAAIAKTAPQAVIDAIAKIAVTPDDGRRDAAIAVLGELREPLGVPVLTLVLSERDERSAEAARKALVEVTRQDFGKNVRQWSAWWTANSARHRIEWLMDALSHDVSEIRRAAGEELKTLTKEYFGFSEDLPPRERERAQQRYRDWWVTEGRSRFRRR